MTTATKPPASLWLLILLLLIGAAAVAYGLRGPKKENPAQPPVTVAPQPTTPSSTPPKILATNQPTEDEGDTPLHKAAAAGGAAETLKSLLDAGANPDAANKAGVTPLMRAAEAGDANKCIALLNAGANPAAKDAAGRTAADWARKRVDEQGARCADLLAQAGG